MEAKSGIRELAKAAAATVAAEGWVAAPPPERKYIGVRRYRGCKMYSVETRDPSGGKLWLGSFDTAVEAACVYDAAVRTLRPHDANAKTNFPEPPATEEEKAKRAAVVLACVDELKCKRVVADAAKAAAAADAGSSAVAPPPPPPALAAQEGEASGSQVALSLAGEASCSLSRTAAATATRKKVQGDASSQTGTNRPSAFQPYLTTGGCTMANISPAQFQLLYRQFV